MFAPSNDWDTPAAGEDLCSQLFAPLDKIQAQNSNTSVKEFRNQILQKPSSRKGKKKLLQNARDLTSSQQKKRKDKSRNVADKANVEGKNLSESLDQKTTQKNKKFKKRKLNSKPSDDAGLANDKPDPADSRGKKDSSRNPQADNSVGKTSGLESGSEKPQKHRKEQSSFLEQAEKRLKGSRFRMLNEALYTSTTEEAAGLFGEDSSASVEYHEGYREQISAWPEKPVEKIVHWLKSKPKNWTVADLGCGEALISASVPQTVHSFDLYALNERVRVANMTGVPLEDQSVHVAIFCLSLMGTNVVDCLVEARRILKIGGVLKIAEVGSRFDNLRQFIDKVERLGFAVTSQQISDKNYFVMLEFKKIAGDVQKKALPDIRLKPCIYKRR